MGKENLEKKKWKYYSPTFEFTKDLPLMSSAWSGHYFFVYDLIRNTQPHVVVELGTHKGNSLFSMAQAIKDGKLKTELHAVDTWKGDPQTGYYGEEVYEEFLRISKEYYKDIQIIPHKMLFDDTVKIFEENSIDILHIDGLHTYEAVKHDFETWLPKVNKDTGIIMFHDVCETKDDFGVYKLWDELKKKYRNTITFKHYHGLGVIFLNNDIKDIEKHFSVYYTALSKNQDLEYSLEETGRRNKEMEKELIEVHNTLGEKERIIGERDKAIQEKDKIIIEKDKAMQDKDKLIEEYQGEVEEFRTFKKGKIWKALTIWRKFKKYFKNFFINIRNDGVVATFKRMPTKIKSIIKNRKQRDMENNPYKYWVKNNQIDKERKEEIRKEIDKLKYHPLISIVMPVYNVDVKWIREAVRSIKNQIYTNWELCIADDASTKPRLRRYLERISQHEKIKVVFREKNGHISEATNSALKLVEGEFVALMDNDDYIYPHALAEVVKVLNKKPETDFIYSDEDKLEMTGKRVDPFFKPDWSPDLFMSTNYLCHFTLARKKIIDLVGGFRKGYEGSQDYDLFLRITEKTQNIEHIPDILYSWRKIPGSTAAVYSDKGYAQTTSLQSLKDALKRRKIKGTVTKGLFPGSFRVKYDIVGNPLVSIIIPTKDKREYIERCISSLLSKTTYNNYEIIIVDTGSTEKDTLEYYETIKNNPKIRFVYWKKPFNYSSVNNFGVQHAKGEYILLLNNDTEVISHNWIEGMLEHAQREEIGAVGVKLLYPDDRTQHVGVILGVGGPTKEESIANHAMRLFSNDIAGIPYTKDIIRNYSAVTAACLMVKKDKFEKIGGFEEKLRIAFNDVDLCLKLWADGLFNLYTPYVELYHHESVSVGTPNDGKRDMDEFKTEVEYMRNKWGEVIETDPFYNKNLTWRNTSYTPNYD